MPRNSKRDSGLATFHTFFQVSNRDSASPSSVNAKAERNLLPDHECSLTITTSGLSDRSAWYSLQEASVPLAGACVPDINKGYRQLLVLLNRGQM